MKKILVVIVLLLIVSLYSDERYLGCIHRYILQEGVKFLEHYYMYEEFHDDNEQNIKYNNMRYGSWKEDANDWIYGYAESNGPNVYVTGIDDLTEWFIENELASITHFWDADNSGLYENNDNDIDSGYMWNQEYTIHNIPSAVTKAYTTIYGHDDLIHYKELSYNCSSPQEFSLVEGGTISLSCNPGFFLSIKSLEDYVDSHNIFIMGHYEPGMKYFYEEPYYVHLSDGQFEPFSSQHPEFVYTYLGRIIHLIADMAVPAHVHNDNHAPNFNLGGWDTSACDNYEGWDFDGPIWGSGGYLRNSLDNIYWDADLTLQEYPGLIEVPSEYTDEDFLFDLFYSINQVTDMFASDDKDGDLNSHLIHPFSNYPFITEMSDKFVNEILPNYPNIQNDHEITNNGEREAIRDFCIPTAIRAVATFLHWYAINNDFTPTWMLLNNVNGNVSLNGGEGDIENVSIIFDPQNSGSNIEPDIDANGDYSYGFSYDEFGTYDITYELFSVDGDYYPITIEDVVIDETTAPLTLDDIVLQPITDPTNVIVSSNESIPAFRNIQDAIDYLSAHNSGTINVLSGTYTGDRNKNINWFPDMQPDGLHITIKGIGECIIDCGGSGIAFNFNLPSYYQYNENDIIENIIIKNAYQGIVIEHGSPIIKNNTIEDCTLPFGYDYTHGAGICCKSSATIENNTIRNNVGNWGNEEEYRTYGGGIYVENNTSNATIIKNNFVSGNSAYNGGGIYCTGSGKIILDGNEITENTLVAGSNFPYPADGTGIYCYNCADLEVRNNVICENISYPLNSSGIAFSSIYCDNVIIENNTIVNNENHTGIGLKTYLPAIINNNIVSNNKYGIRRVSLETPIITYCCVSNNPSGNYYGGATSGTGCLEEDVDPHLDNQTHQPLWNSTTKSPCIDVGDPALSLDPDGTPSDIGAIPAVTHKCDIVELPSPEEDNNGWKWLSFPALDNVYSTANYDPDVAEFLLYDIMQDPIPTILDIVETENYDIWYYLNQYWQNDWQQFHRTEGFKFHMNDDFTLEVPGFKEYDNTTIVLEGNNVENWVGYWLEETQLVSDAFSDYWDASNIYFIQHQYWTATYFGGEWWYRVQSGHEPTLSYGDMVIVKCNTTINNFQWESGTPVERTVFAETEYFTYEEQADYTPLYIELDSNNMPQEIGAFVNGECIGATVVEDTLTQINAYIASVPPGNIELELYYGNRSENKQISSYNCVTSSNPNVIMKQLTTKDKDDAWFIDLREGSEIIPEIIEFSASNYPNPFNPTTTISYSLPLEGKVSLNIYNVKGQLVRQLIDGSQPEGYYKVVWNGKDNNEKSVSSGIYFYKLSTKDKTIMKKMLMLK